MIEKKNENMIEIIKNEYVGMHNMALFASISTTKRSIINFVEY